MAETKTNLHELSVDDLKAKLSELTEERFRLRFRSATESIENPMRFRHLRRDIARVKTILRARELGLGDRLSGRTQLPEPDDRETMTDATRRPSLQAEGPHGVVTSDKMTKTVTVTLTRRFAHRRTASRIDPQQGDQGPGHAAPRWRHRADHGDPADRQDVCWRGD
jgi:large subunit ribosomal protein L29